MATKLEDNDNDPQAKFAELALEYVFDHLTEQGQKKFLKLLDTEWLVCNPKKLLIVRISKAEAEKLGKQP